MGKHLGNGWNYTCTRVVNALWPTEARYRFMPSGRPPQHIVAAGPIEVYQDEFLVFFEPVDVG